jgi:hypothetical protein
MLVFLADFALAGVVTALLARIVELIARLVGDDGGDAGGGGGGWRYRPTGPRGGMRRTARGGPRSPLQPRPRVRR